MDNISTEVIIEQEDQQYKYIIGYYFVLGIIQALWTNQHAFPPMALRLLITALVLLPMFFKKEIIPFVLVFSMTLRMYLSTKYSYLPDISSINLYFLCVLGLLVWHRSLLTNITLKKEDSLPLFILIIFGVIIDLLNNGVLGRASSFYIFAFSLLFFYKDRESVEYGLAGFVMVSIFLAAYYYIMYDQFLEDWNRDEGLERSGWADPNYFSIHLGIGLMFSLSLLFGILKTVYIHIHHYILIFGSFVIFLAIVMTGSRAGLLSSLAIFFIAIWQSDKSLREKIIPILFIPFIIILVLMSGYGQLILYRLFVEENIDTAGGRTAIWQLALSNFPVQDWSYFLFGGGWMHRVNLTNGMDTHNEIIGVLCDYGVIGLVISITLYISILANKVYDNIRFRLYIPMIYLFLMFVSLSPSRYIIMPLFTSWLIMSYKMMEDEDFLLINDNSTY